jgi:hypothetical protein
MEEQASHRCEEIIPSLAREMLRSFGEFRFVARGSSMVPRLFPGDTLIVLRTGVADVCAGEILLLVHQGRLYAHRLVDKKLDKSAIRLITRGDALAENDPPFTESELLGRIPTVIRRGKRIEFDNIRPSVGQSLLRWIVQRSDSSMKWLLRWHSLRESVSRAWSSGRRQTQREGA